MTKKATAGIDPTCIELVRAGLITYRQLNEVHRLVQETGGTYEDVLVGRGYVKKEQLAGRRIGAKRAKKKSLRVSYSLDLVKTGLLTFKQLNECHRMARQSKGQKTVVDVMIERGYVTDVQLATLPPAAERSKHKRFSSSWDLFRAGVVSLKALNECHKYVKVDAPGKSLKEALVERGVITKDQLVEIERKKASGELREKGPVRSPFMEKYARELEGIPEDLREQLRREHLAAQGISPEEDEARARAAVAAPVAAPEGEIRRARPAAPPAPAAEGEIRRAPKTAAPPKREAAAPVSASAPEDVEAGEDASELQAAKTFMDVGGDEGEAVAVAEDEDEDEAEDEEEGDFQAAKTFLGADEADEAPADDLQAQKTMVGEDDGDEAVEFRAARTFMGGDEEDEEEAAAEGGADFQGSKTMVGGDEDEEAPGDLQAARTFMDAGAPDEDEAPKVEEPKKDPGVESSAEIQGARTFMDVGDVGSSADVKGARTFMDMGDGSGHDIKPAAAKPAAARPAADADKAAGGTFMDMDVESGGGGMFGGSETASGVGPGMMMKAADLEGKVGDKSQFQRQDTHVGGEGEGATFMDLEGNAPAAATKSSALREAFEKAGASGASGAGASGTEFDAKSGKSSASQTSVSRTEVGSKSGASGAGTTAVGAGSGTSTAAGSKSGSSGATSTPAATTAGAAGSGTEADAETEKKKRKKKKEEEDAYKHPLVGKVIGGCRIVKKLGEGGMGAVFLSEHTKLKRQSVIKVVPAHLSQNRQLIARFEREARAAAIVQHPNIVAVYNVGEENGVHYIEMEFVDGQALDGILKEKKVLEQMECVRIIKDACKGLHEAHKNGIIHRDIKPDNIMMTRKGQVKIADFGLARAGSEDVELTKKGQILGTPAYMSPEQCQGKETDLRADIYSLGATFYAMITGKRPFTGASVMEIMQKHIDEEPISPREYNAEIAPQVVKIILKMMAKKPEDRFQSTDDIVQAIDRFLKEEGAEALQEAQKAIGDDYKIVKKIGQGGMGAVFLARAQLEKGRIKKDDAVAIKLLNSDMKNKEDIDRFEQEAKVALQIDHDNIIRVVDYKISEQANYIVMEFVDGLSVRDMLKSTDKEGGGDKKLPAPEALRIVRDAAKGLMRAHELGIIHRDMKPDNIMIAKSGEVKLADFGAAKATDRTIELTKVGSGDVIGSPPYMPPEQWDATKGAKVTIQADIYALGATLYFMVTGKKPFEGETQMAIMMQHFNTPPKPPREVVPELDESLSNVILNMMAKKPKYRYATLQDVLRDLDAAEKGKKVRKRRNVDVSFEETGKGKTFVGVAVAAVIVVTVALVLLTRDPKGQARKEMDSRVAQTESKVSQELPGKRYKDLADQVQNSRLALESLDFTAGKELVAEFKPRLDALKSKVEVGRAERDKLADALRDKLKKARAAADGEVGKVEGPEASSAAEDQGRALANAERCIAAYGEACGLALEADEKTFGDSTLVAEAAAAQRDMVSALNGMGRRRLELGKEFARNTLVPMQYFQVALARFSDFKKVWEKMPIPGRQPMPLDVGKDVEAAIEDYRVKEKELEGDLARFRDSFYEAEQIELRERSAYKKEQDAGNRDRKLSYSKIIGAYAESKGSMLKIGGAALLRSNHKKWVEERLGALQSERDSISERTVSKAKDDALGAGNEGKPRTAVRFLDDAVATVKVAYDETDEAQNKSLKPYLQRLAEVKKSVYKNVLQAWNDRQAELERQAWLDRKFLAAAASYAKYAEVDEYREPIATAEDADGKPINFVTIHDQALERIEALKFNLNLLRPWEEQQNVGSMVEVKDAGPVWIGTDEKGSAFKNQRPRHEVEVKGFYVDRTEVTVAQFVRFLKTDPKTGRYVDVNKDDAQKLFLCREHDPAESPFCDTNEPRSKTGHAPPGIFDEVATQKPVTFASYYDALAFAKWAGKRLPKEAEWEKAASWDPTLGRQRVYPWGDAFNTSLLVMSGADDNWADLSVADANEAGKSPYGALNMSGNVWEWCVDAYQAYKGAKNEDLDPDYGNRYRVLRGGSNQDSRETAFMSRGRFPGAPSERKANVGFRCVRDAE